LFLKPDVETEMLQLIARDVCRGQEAILPVKDMTAEDLRAVMEYISQPIVSQAAIDQLNNLCPERPMAKNTVYLLRGLIVHRILLMALKKRWNVQYGLHPLRYPMAVPFHAKGVPSERSEWGHPDSAILLTCLAFYYEGISLEQLRESLGHILKSDEPTAEYDRLTKGAVNLPGALRDWSSINIDDDLTVNDIWRSMRYSLITIDYYLNNFVFSRYARQFKHKLQSSGWDIPSATWRPRSSAHPKRRRPLTTGFSGTNDNRNMLPLNIRQQDLPKLQHTNAEVLTYLLAPASRGYFVTRLKQQRMTESQILHHLSKRSIDVLIDTGAMFLEMDNHSLVKTWLKIAPTKTAALYFDETDHRPWIQPKQGPRVPLAASIYSEDLTDVLVYLDEVCQRVT
jgi:hypothetical protein